jgi:hypothetical protein
MKKFLITTVSIAAMAIAAPAFGQSVSTITQSGANGADANVHQSGDVDTSTITQNTGGGGPFDHLTANVKQSGDYNTSTLLQTGAGSSNAFVEQIGDSNTSYLEQDRVGDNANVSQRGYNGYSYALQSGESASAGDAGTVGVLQRASSQNAESYLIQGGRRNSALVDQGGDSNLSTIRQNSGQLADHPDTTNTASATQTGSYNFSLIYQGETNGLSSGNTANLTQTGDSNQSWITQNDDNNTANVTQAGYGDFSVVTQSGGNMNATVLQN